MQVISREKSSEKSMKILITTPKSERLYYGKNMEAWQDMAI